jgi:predicted transcriptional regulator
MLPETQPYAVSKAGLEQRGEFPRAMSTRLGQWLRDLRGSVKLTQAELSVRAELAQPAICRLEVGRVGRSGPELLTLQRYLAGCGYALILTAEPITTATAKVKHLTALEL